MTRHTRFPNLSQLDAEAVRATAAQCKAMRHFFVPTSGSGWVPSFGHGVAFRCINCGSWRFDTFSRFTDELIVRSYDLSPEYKAVEAQSHREWVSEYLNHLADDEIAMDSEAPAERVPGLRNSYRRKGV